VRGTTTHYVETTTALGCPGEPGSRRRRIPDLCEALLSEPLIQNISDTALWVAVYRANETDRPDALFRDPFARRLAGPRGEQIAEKLGFSGQDSWPFVARTCAFDGVIREQIRTGVDTVLNLAAGLDTRPYRMDLPASLKWIEVDLPAMIDYKQEILAGEEPSCTLERICLDLRDTAARRNLFQQMARTSRKVLIITEGLLVYLSPEEVGTFAADLAISASFQSWVLDLASPGLLRRLQQTKGAHLNQANASALKFGPTEGPEYFVRYGWRPAEVHSMLRTAGRLKRLPFWMRILAKLPESNGRQGSRPWGGVCLYHRVG
jgi:methyltransferase (TIGR00027 family)